MKFGFEKELRVGQVTEIRGKKVICRIFENKNGPYVFINGEIIKNVTIGSYAVIPVGYNLIIGKIEGEYAVEKPNGDLLYNEIELVSRKVEISILGTYDNEKFTLGISYMPLINSDLYIAPKYLLNNLFVFSSDKSKDDDVAINIGTDIDNNLPVFVSIEKLFANHIGIFGNTGSGKSNTLAYLFTKLFEKYDFDYHNQFIFLDYSNEYKNCFTTNKTIINLGEEDEELLYLAREDVFNSEFWLSLTEAAEKTHAPFIKESLRKYNSISSFSKLREDLGNLLNKTLSDVKAERDKKTINQIERYLEKYTEETDYNKFFGSCLYVAVDKFSTAKSQYLDANFWALINRIELNCNNLKNYIKFQKRDINYKNILVINMNRLTLENKLIISYLVANRYYKLFNNRRTNDNTINLVIDEAHKILSIPQDSDKTPFKEYILKKFEEFIKEGRKFGFYLTIASQRPSDISSMFLSQMHNYFIHRLINQNDIDNLSNTISFLDENSFKMISSLKVGSCIYSGLGAKFPIIVNIPKLQDDVTPKSKNISITANAKLKV